MNWTSIFLFTGALQAFLLSFVIFIKRPSYKTPKFWLGIFVLSFAWILFDNWGIAVELGDTFPLFNWTYYRIVSIVPLSFWLYTKKLTHYQVPNQWVSKIGWGVLGLELCLLAFNFFTQSDYENKYLITTSLLLDLLGLCLTSIVFPLSLIALKKYQMQLNNNYSDSQQLNYQWLKQLLYVTAFLILVWLFVVMLDIILGDEALPYYWLHIPMVTTVFFIGIKGYLQPTILHDFELAPTFEIQQSSEQPLSNEKIDTTFNSNELALLEQIRSLMEDEKLYHVQKLSVQDLAKRLHQSPKLVSQLINRYHQKSFSDYVNFFRVEEVKNRILEGDHKQHTMIALAYDAGFNSKSSFYAIFKKFTDLSPTTFAEKFYLK